MENTNGLKAVLKVNGSVEEILSVLLRLWRCRDPEIQEACLLLKSRFQKDCVSLLFSTRVPIEANIENWTFGSFPYTTSVFEMSLTIHHGGVTFVIVEHCEVCDGDPWADGDFIQLRVVAPNKGLLHETMLVLGGVSMLESDLD